ncbi:transcriptional regulator [Pandoraea horticolens]|uniref:Transcriptional regulator n=2 Tax=Pandoraea horticolens TaxID=2508298 RepID=A0A5E4VTR0_9BURK|nr:transcriptional regulator [Pandoraea horticolens]
MQTAPDNNPGNALRALRKKLKLTLQDASERTGLPISTFSKLEMGKMSLSFERLSAISTGLGIDFSELVSMLADGSQAKAKPAGLGRRVIQRLGDGLPINSSSYGYVYLAVELLQKKLVPMVGEIYATTMDEFLSEFGDLQRHPGEEFMYVLEGEMELHTDLYTPARLKAGDSVYLDSMMGHAYLKASEGPCKVLCVCTNEHTGGGLGLPAIP